MFIFLAIVAVGIIIFLASKREKQERIERVTNLGEEILYMQTYICDVMLAGHDMIFDDDTDGKFGEFKKLLMNSQKVIYILEDQIRRGEQRNADKTEQQEAIYVLEDIRTLKQAVSTSDSLDDLHTKLQGKMKSYIVDAFTGDVTRAEILELKANMTMEFKELERKVISSI